MFYNVPTINKIFLLLLLLLLFFYTWCLRDNSPIPAETRARAAFLPVVSVVRPSPGHAPTGRCSVDISPADAQWSGYTAPVGATIPPPSTEYTEPAEIGYIFLMAIIGTTIQVPYQYLKSLQFI